MRQRKGLCWRWMLDWRLLMRNGGIELIEILKGL